MDKFIGCVFKRFRDTVLTGGVVAVWEDKREIVGLVVEVSAAFADLVLHYSWVWV